MQGTGQLMRAVGVPGLLRRNPNAPTDGRICSRPCLGRNFAKCRKASMQQKRRVTCAQASTSSQNPLETYSIDTRRNSPILERSVQETVRHLDEAPFMHLMYTECGTRFERYSVPEAVVTVPQLWQGIAEHLTQRNPELQILVHRVTDGSSSAACPKITQQPLSADPPSSILQCSNRLLTAGLAQHLMAGKVGECCEGHEGEESHSHSEGSPDHSPDSQEYIDMALKRSGMYDEGEMKALHQDIAFWGLVVQSEKFVEVEGCYLLKTVRNVDPTGCSCTHFSLLKVCRGVPLCDQVTAAWLV